MGVISGLGVQPFYLPSYWLGRRGRVKPAVYVSATVVFLAPVKMLVEGHRGTVTVQSEPGKKAALSPPGYPSAAGLTRAQ